MARRGMVVDGWGGGEGYSRSPETGRAKENLYQDCPCQVSKKISRLLDRHPVSPYNEVYGDKGGTETRGGGGITMVARGVVWLVLTLFCCSPVWAGQAAGYVAACQGEVYAIDGEGVTRALAPKAAVAEGDYIVTEEKGRVRIVFEDNTVVALGEKSRLKLSDYAWSKKRQRGRFEVTVSEGIFRIIGGKITKTDPKSFVAKTPAASIGIRGSGYAGRVAGKKLEVFLLHGKGVDVKNRKGSAALLFPGMGTTVENSASAPTRPRLFTAMEMQEIESGSEVGGIGGNGGSGSGVSGTIVNQAEISNSVNIAVGKDNTATMGSVRIKDSQVDGTVVNQSEVKDSANVAAGSDNQAATGSINVK